MQRAAVQHTTLNTQVPSAADAQCGRVVSRSIHLNATP
jgi:hypothetical protein